MAPTIKIDTSVQATKRGLPENDDAGLDILGADLDNPKLEAGNTEDVPPFLCQSVSEIHDKFEDLEWMQRARLAEGQRTSDLSHRWALETDPRVKERNRYCNVQAWANCRIHLRVPEGECDFINASPIRLEDSVTRETRKYIATQGPKLGHLAEFWHMVFHESQEVGVIVMLTQTFEAGREKCAQYFPLDTEQASMVLLADESDVFFAESEQTEPGVLGRVTLLESTFDARSRSEIRKLELAIGSESKIVWHFLFAGWADYSKPEGSDRQALLDLIKLSASKSSSDNPRIVHCSAGVGRTGTFIALDHLLCELESGHLLDMENPQVDPVFDCVDQMRTQRMMMVYNEMQMQFIYEVLREQTDRKLGKITDWNMDSPDGSEERSAKIAKLNDQADYLPTSKPELEAVPDRAHTPRSRSGTPELPGSDNELTPAQS
ncbi:Protein-tyrosine phosphatase catalytic [Penicillium fimorum]|uniref:Protein-tyrosine phosphatase catalytic n=1 Tax=Penicillium fimorum TaxID=1882269 RepID=A0A9X0C184_9EURO|nr:Protein-tyrosine phosphatase catalytic [Penicillium fimorum]